MVKMRTFLIAALTALSFTAAAQDKANIETSLEKVKRKISFERGETAFKFSGKSKLARLTVKIGDTEYDIRDGCLPYLGLGDCKLDDKPDICAVYENRVITQNLWGVEEAEPVCGDIYRKTKDEFIDYHVDQIKRLLKGKEVSVSLGRIGKGKGVTVTDEKTVKYSVFDQDNDGVAETFIIKTKSNPYFPKLFIDNRSNLSSSELFIDKNKSESIEGKIGGLYKFIEAYVMENFEE